MGHRVARRAFYNVAYTKAMLQAALSVPSGGC